MTPLVPEMRYEAYQSASTSVDSYTSRGVRRLVHDQVPFLLPPAEPWLLCQLLQLLREV